MKKLFTLCSVLCFLYTHSQTISTGSVSGSPFCAGSVANVPLTITGSFNVGNVFTAELSDAAGSFASPIAIGTLASTSSGTVSGTIPFNTSAGTGYRIRVSKNLYQQHWHLYSIRTSDSVAGQWFCIYCIRDEFV